MKDRKNYNVYLFDFDYTLCDSGEAITMCYRHVLEKHGYDGISDFQIQQMIGTPLYDAMVLLTEQTDKDIVNGYCDEFQEYADEVMAENTYLFPFTMDLLKELRSMGKKIGIISTKERRHITASFDRYEMYPYIDILIAVDDNCPPKPDPAGILLAMERLGGTKEDTLYTGDSLIDAYAAKNAGLDFVAVTTGTTEEKEFHSVPTIAILKDASRMLK